MADRAIMLDTETTGLSHKEGDRVIEIGAVEYIGSLPTGNVFHRYMNPGRRKVHEDAFKVHQISDEFLADKPPMSVVMPEFLDFIKDSPLVIHNAPFDVGFLNSELSLLKLPKLPNQIIDTLDIARRLFPTGRNSLDSLCVRYNIDSSERVYHGALIDASLLGSVYVHLTGKNQLNFGDNSAISPQGSYGVGEISAASMNRPARRRRDPVSPTENEISQHSAFIKKKIKDSLWSSFSAETC